jgi:Cu+-exporting ATPase
MTNTAAYIKAKCYHCGDSCNDDVITAADKQFCCEGCKQVYLLLNENNLCVYYDFDKSPGIKTKGKFVSERFAYLDDEAVINKLVQFNSAKQVNVTFSLPQMHCSSCVYLLENLHRINNGIIKSQTNFQRKQIFISYNPAEVSLRKITELLAFIGYEPHISLEETVNKKTGIFNRSRMYKIGVAGFCFANIMMLSFPEYFSSGKIEQHGLKETFAWLNLILSLPVLLYSASGFFISAWKGLRLHFLNIDAPVSLAIIVTYARSYYEIISGTGSGYLDSGTGIVFFMLVGRWFQDKTYDSFSFERDYRSYFPLGVTVINTGIEKNVPITKLKKGDRIIIRNEEMIPADAVLIKGNACVDYSFISGENAPVQKNKGELIYAGGTQTGSAIELQVTGEVSQSYITQLWNNNDIFSSNKKNEDKSFIHPWSRYFTVVLFSVALATLIFWSIYDTSKILPAVSSVLIVACPCSLLLSATFTNGNMLRLFGKNKMYLKNASVIETMAKIKTVVLDKTGTITQNNASLVKYEGTPLTENEKRLIKAVTSQSSHPLSKIISTWLMIPEEPNMHIEEFKENAGKGIEAVVNGTTIKIGSMSFINLFCKRDESNNFGTQVHVMINNELAGMFIISNQYRNGITEMIARLINNGYRLFLLSGDNDSEKNNLQHIFGKKARLHFNQSPQQKLDFIKTLQQKGEQVLMIGDGLNDAGALMQSNTGVAVSDNTSHFSPACDAILHGSKVQLLDKFLAFARSGKKIVTASFILSILYNLAGLSFAVQGLLSPMVAAILMPASSISIVVLVTALSSLKARLMGL